MTEKIAKVRSEFQAAVNKDKALLAASEEILRAYAEQQKDEWPTKAADLTFCVVGFRKGSQKVVLPEDKTEEQALADIKKNKVLAAVFVAVTESIDRKAILGCKNDTLLKKLNTATGVHVGREPDRFYIKPKTEEVTA